MSQAVSDSTLELSPELPGFELLVTGHGGVFSRALPSQGELLIGRAEGAEIQLTGNSVSRRHALLRIRGAELFLEDLGSANGTTIRGERIPPHREHPVILGESLLVGEVVLVVRSRRAVALPPAVAGRAGAGNDTPLFVLCSPKMVALRQQIEPVARADLNLLILGETGVGKDVFARSIHERSSRRDRPFLRLNCAALPEQLLESELFGHEKGAFTGATRSTPGLLLATTGGTVFLDEIGELPSRLQAKLLQVVETREVLSVGSTKPRPFDVRFIAATNRDLELEAAMGAFRSDLYYRLAGFTAVIPPLRERREDILPLAQEFLRRANREPGASGALRIRDAAAARLLDHPWPGNVRELRNVIERALVLAEGRPIGPEHLPLESPRLTPKLPNEGRESDAAFELPVANLTPREISERGRIVLALAACSGNQGKAAEKLGVSRSTLLNRLDAYRIGRPRKRP